MNDIYTLPDNKDWGLDFNYANWGAGATITMAQVPWSNDYRDVVHFNSDAAITNYLRTQPDQITLDEISYLGFGQPIRLDIPFHIAQKYNYLRAYNPAQPIAGDVPKAFYYFILDVVRVAPNTTVIYIQLDAWQSFSRSTEFGQVYVEQGHVGIAAANGFNNYGRDHLTISEGLDVGGEYQITKNYSQDIANTYAATGNYSYNYSVLVVTNINLTGDPGTVDKPKLNSATGSNFENLPNGCEVYAFFSPAQFAQFMKDYSNKPWVTQGIISITAIPKLDRYGIDYDTVTIPGSVSAYKLKGGRLDKKKVDMKANWREDVLATFPAKYQKLRKLLTYPFTVLELTTYVGQPVVIKPESWNNPHATVVESAHIAPPSQRIAIYPYKYNAAISGDTTSAQGVENDNGEFLDMATYLSNFPTFSLVNNSYVGYLASNSNSIAYQHSSADWGNTKALAGADNTANNATMGITASGDQATIGINATNAQNNLNNSFAVGNAAIGAASGIAGGAAMGPGGLASGVSGAAMSGLSTGMNIAQSNMATGIATGATRAGNDRSNQLSSDLRDSNKAYANMAANGDYSQAIAGINARVNDAKLSQPTTSGQIGGDAFVFTSYKMGYDLKVKTISGAALIAAGDYMLRYGYRINRFMRLPDNFQVMSLFTFWKCKEVYITKAQCPEAIKQTLRGILEKGVTVWGNPYSMGVAPIENNIVVTGVII